MIGKAAFCVLFVYSRSLLFVNSRSLLLVELYICLLKFALVTLINCALSKFESYFKLKRNTYLSYLWPNWNISSDLAFTAGRLFLALTPAYFECILSPLLLYRLIVLYRLVDVHQSPSKQPRQHAQPAKYPTLTQFSPRAPHPQIQYPLQLRPRHSAQLAPL